MLLEDIVKFIDERFVDVGKSHVGAGMISLIKPYT